MLTDFTPMTGAASDDKYIRSTLETVDINTAERITIYVDASHFEAPNWSRDGRFFVLNKAGALYRLSVDGTNFTKIDTGFADRLNNDHGLSPDGSLLAISHHAQSNGGQSVIYTLPVEGGTPTPITPYSPSYWHGWSPDGTTLVYTAGRGNSNGFDIYTIPANGGEETKLTSTPGLDDGPDFSPDGQFIYYNSYRSGIMQIWRMRTDGSDQQQLVESQHSDWFPHPSPDGQKVVFLRYIRDQGEEHPFGQDVQLMIMDTERLVTRPLTEVFFGGQGTINVPSWSPDSRRVAFVSYEMTRG